MTFLFFNPLYPGFLSYIYQPIVKFIILFQTEFIRRNTKVILTFNTTYWIYPLEFFPMYLKCPVIQTLFAIHRFLLIFPSFLYILFIFRFFRGGSFKFVFSCINHLGQNVILIGVFPLDCVV